MTARLNSGIPIIVTTFLVPATTRLTIISGTVQPTSKNTTTSTPESSKRILIGCMEWPNRNKLISMID